VSAKPRRCSARWLDSDCPREVLAIIDLGKREPSLERFDVIYTDVVRDGRDDWLGLFCLSEEGYGYHVEMLAHKVAAYRYRMKHRYTKWSALPDAVKAAVRRDIELGRLPV
jgi:hypothetical protein